MREYRIQYFIEGAVSLDSRFTICFHCATYLARFYFIAMEIHIKNCCSCCKEMNKMMHAFGRN